MDDALQAAHVELADAVRRLRDAYDFNGGHLDLIDDATRDLWEPLRALDALISASH